MEERIKELLERLNLANGELISLKGKKTRFGEQVYISTRYTEYFNQ